jgi:hypothetical protein
VVKPPMGESEAKEQSARDHKRDAKSENETGKVQ